MASCKDCLHYKPCKDWAIDCFHGNTIFPYEAETGKELCEYYTPTADVTPKSEVQRIFEELYKSVVSKIPPHIRPIFKDDMDFDCGFINGKRDAFIEVLMIIAELKKKYTEEKT